jgi:hypothetical protein
MVIKSVCMMQYRMHLREERVGDARQIYNFRLEFYMAFILNVQVSYKRFGQKKWQQALRNCRRTVDTDHASLLRHDTCGQRQGRSRSGLNFSLPPVTYTKWLQGLDIIIGPDHRYSRYSYRNEKAT